MMVLNQSAACHTSGVWLILSLYIHYTPVHPCYSWLCKHTTIHSFHTQRINSQ